MNKKMIVYALAAMMTASVMAGCGTSSTASETTAAETAESEAAETTAAETTAAEAAEETESSAAETESIGAADEIANPWTETDAQGMAEAVGISFNEPEGASNLTYSICEADGIGQMQYTDEAGTEICARTKSTGSAEDISGMNYTWTYTEDVQVGSCEGQLMQAEDGDQTVEVLTWFDAVPGISYSLSAVGSDLDGFDLLGVADAIYEPMQGEAYSDDYIAVCGNYTSDYDGSTITLGEDGSVDVSLVRLADLQGTSSDIENGVLTFQVTDPADGSMTLSFDTASGELTVTESTWENLPEGDSFTFAKD